MRFGHVCIIRGRQALWLAFEFVLRTYLLKYAINSPLAASFAPRAFPRDAVVRFARWRYAGRGDTLDRKIRLPLGGLTRGAPRRLDVNLNIMRFGIGLLCFGWGFGFGHQHFRGITLL